MGLASAQRAIRNPHGPNLSTPQTYNGVDCAVIFNIPFINHALLAGQAGNLSSVQLQTITMSSSSSVLPVRRIGEGAAAQYTKGARTFAGSMVFTIIEQDPFQQLFSIDALNNSVRGDGLWHYDQMPPFDCILLLQNETGGIGLQVIQDITLLKWGTTVSVDDLFIESTYTYVARHITPFISNKFSSYSAVNPPEVMQALEDLVNQLHSVDVNPDALFNQSVIEDQEALANPDPTSQNQVDIPNLPGGFNASSNTVSFGWMNMLGGDPFLNYQLATFPNLYPDSY